MIGFFDLEFNPKNELLVIGILFKKRYYYFTNILDFINFLKNSKIKILYGYNIEYDIGIIIRKINLEKYKIKLKCIYNMCGMVSSELDIDDKKIKVKDLSRHVPIGLGKIGEMIGMKKMEIDYNFNKIDKKLIEYNKNDLKITYMLYNRLNKCYKKLHTGIKNTIASTSFAIYKKMIHIPTVDENIKEVFIKAYKGGLVNVYKTGTYEGNFFKLDVNSLYPFVMLSQFPNPTTYYISNKPSGKMYLIIYDDGDVFTNYDAKIFNINKKIKCYICFKQYIYPFKLYIEKINKYKENAKNDLERTIFKLIMNGLYGKFAERIIPIKIIYAENIKDIKIGKNVKLIEQYAGTNFYRVVYNPKFSYFANVIYSVFVTAKARYYMYRLRRLLLSCGYEIYYEDTDSFIISANNLEKIKKYIDPKKIGKLKIEGCANKIKILGKKLYIFGDEIKSKGVPKKYAKEFIENGLVKFSKIVKIREGLRRRIKIGDVIEIEKRNLKNKVLDKRL